jgi:hypothetical protein
MDRRQLVIDIINKKEREVQPYRLDLSDKVKKG